MTARWYRLSPVVVVCLLALGAGRGVPEAGTVMTAQAPAGAADERVTRGRALFNDTKLSGDGQWSCGQWSCATCHPNNGHTNNKTYVGVEVVANGDPKGRSTPTLWGVATRQAYSWAGTAPSVCGYLGRGLVRCSCML